MLNKLIHLDNVFVCQNKSGFGIDNMWQEKQRTGNDITENHNIPVGPPDCVSRLVIILKYQIIWWQGQFDICMIFMI